MILAKLLVIGGFAVCYYAFFPLSVSNWLSREVQALIGFVAAFLGITVFAFRALLEEHRAALWAHEVERDQVWERAA